DLLQKLDQSASQNRTQQEPQLLCAGIPPACSPHEARLRTGSVDSTPAPTTTSSSLSRCRSYWPGFARSCGERQALTLPSSPAPIMPAPSAVQRLTRRSSGPFASSAAVDTPQS